MPVSGFAEKETSPVFIEGPKQEWAHCNVTCFSLTSTNRAAMWVTSLSGFSRCEINSRNSSSSQHAQIFPSHSCCRPLIEFAVSMAMSSITFVNTVLIKEQRVLVFRAALRSFTTFKWWLNFFGKRGNCTDKLPHRHGHIAMDTASLVGRV